MARAEEDETPPAGKIFVSASQLKLFMFGCERKWGFTYLMKLRTPSGRGARVGSLVHEGQLEPYLKEGKPLDFSIMDEESGIYPAEVAAPMLQYLPEPKSPGLGVETYFKFEVPELPGVIFRGYIDYTVEPQYNADQLPLVGDHKTTGNWAYALTADQLEWDLQAILYAKYTILKYPSMPAVTLQWGYMGTKKPHLPKPVRATLTRAQVDVAFSEVIEGARHLATTLNSRRRADGTPPSEADVLSLPFNAEECPKYSKDGCPFRGTCNLGPRERRPFNMSNATPTDNLLSRIKARQAAETNGTTTPTAPATTGALSPVQAKLAAAKAAAAGKPSISDTLPITPPEQSTASLAPGGYAPGCETPAADPNVIPKAFAPPPQMPTSDQPINPPGEFQPPSAATDVPKPADAPVDAPKTKGPGRPAGSKNKATEPSPAVDYMPLITRLISVLNLAEKALEKYLAS